MSQPEEDAGRDAAERAIEDRAQAPADHEKVRAQIRKLLERGADERGNQNEREAAIRMAHKLMAKHGLEEAEAELRGGAAEARADLPTESRDQPWCRTVAMAVANLFFCGYYYQKRRDGSGKVIHHLIGRVSNAQTAKDIVDYVIASITSEANKQWKQQAEPGPWWTNFCKGAAAQIALRCAALRAEAEEASRREAEEKLAAAQRVAEEQALEAAVQAEAAAGDEDEFAEFEAPGAGGDAVQIVDAAHAAVAAILPPKVTGTALVLASYYVTEAKANDAWVAENVGDLVVAPDRTKAIGDGYGAGRVFGHTVSLNRQVGHEGGKRLRIGKSS